MRQTCFSTCSVFFCRDVAQTQGITLPEFLDSKLTTMEDRVSGKQGFFAQSTQEWGNDACIGQKTPLLGCLGD